MALRVDPGTLARGRALLVAQMVHSMDVAALGDRWCVEGEVQGSQYRPYAVSVELTLSPEGGLATWRSECTCPVGLNCKHGVALTLRAAYRGRDQARSIAAAPEPDRAAPAQSPAEAAQKAEQAAQAHQAALATQQAEFRLAQWLLAIDRATGTAQTVGLRTGAPPPPELYLYLLKVTAVTTAHPQLSIEAVTAYRKLDGDWSKPKAIRTPPHMGQAAYESASDVDRELLHLLTAMRGKSSTYYAAINSAPSAIPNGQAGLLALRLAASTGRLYICATNGSPERVIAWGEPLGLRWSWNSVTPVQGGAPGWVLRAYLDEPHVQLLSNNPPLFLDAKRALCGVVQSPGIDDAQLSVLMRAPTLPHAILEENQLALVERLPGLPPAPMFADVARVTGVTPVAHLALAPHAPAQVPARGLIQAVLRFDYAGHRGWWAGQGMSVMLQGPQGSVLLERDAPAELDAIAALMDLGLVALGGGEFGIAGQAAQQTWLHWSENDFSVLREAGFVVSCASALDGWISYGQDVQVQLHPHGAPPATSGSDTASAPSGDSPRRRGKPAIAAETAHNVASPWFDLSLGMEIDGERRNILPLLPQLIAAAANAPVDAATGQPDLPPFVYLPKAEGQGFIRLPTQALKPWMAALLDLVGERGHDFQADSLTLSRIEALRTSVALGEGVVWEGGQSLRNVVGGLQGVLEITEVAVPVSVCAQLRPYQRQGVNWLQFLRQHGLAGILADDMGLGKTLQTLVHIQIEKDAGRLTHPALIIAPVSLMGNWRQEAARFCPQLRTLVLHGKERHAVAAGMAQHDVVIAPYSLLHRDKERWLEQPWHLVVLDEAQNIKNANTHAAQVVGELQTRHRLCLSGTPMENHLGEVWSLFHFLMPGFLGSQKRFADLFRNPIEKLGNTERLAQLRARVTPFMLRRTKALVASELPPKVETVMRVELSGKQADLYETIRLGMEKSVREALNTKGLAKSQITILDALLKLRQVCCDPALVKLAAAQKLKSSAKLEQLMDMLPEMVAEGRKILLFSQFTSMLTLIEAELKKHQIAWVKLTGQSQKREEIIAQFTSGQVPVFLISLKAGGVGLNLPQADTVIHYDPWWNPAVEAQATDRAHRIGQTQSVWVIKLVAQGTIEERILALQDRKAELAKGLYSGAAQRKQPLFGEDDLAELLKPLG